MLIIFSFELETLNTISESRHGDVKHILRTQQESHSSSTTIEVYNTVTPCYTAVHTNVTAETIATSVTSVIVTVL